MTWDQLPSYVQEDLEAWRNTTDADVTSVDLTALLARIRIATRVTRAHPVPCPR